jgi:ubiquinone/menaquinone biosynthesis C-methylase UbiE
MKIDAQNYDRIARNVFAPVYPLIAEQIIARTGVTRGICLDIGCGGGYLGAALALAADLSVCFFDQSAEMLAIVQRTIAENGLASRAHTLQGNIMSIPLPDACMDLAVSRGSIFFWENLTTALCEIHRVLAPNGWAYVGGGFGSKELKASIIREMKARNQGSDQFRQRMSRNLGPETRVRFEKALETVGIASFSIIDNEEIGLWIVMQKKMEKI